MQLWWRLVRFAFRLLYNEFAFTYDLVSVAVSLGAWRCWQRAALSRLEAQPETPVLELAHGTGNLQLDLLAAGYRPLGLDLSPNMGRIAQKKLRDYGQHSNTLLRSRAQQLPFPTASFQAIVSTFPTSFIIEAQTLSEVWRVLKPGGQFIIVPSGVLVGSNPAGRLLEWLYRITGQREGAQSHIVDLFLHHGFEPLINEQACPRSTAVVIVAHKRD